MSTNVLWPQKTRDLHNHHFDSTVWDDFAFRHGDIVVATYAKTGTTWTQQIVGQLLHNAAEGIDISKFRPPDIAPLEDVRFRCSSRGSGTGRCSGAMCR